MSCQGNHEAPALARAVQNLHGMRQSPSARRRWLSLPRQIMVAALLLGVALGAVAILFPGLFRGTLAPLEPHGVESPGREVQVSLLFDGEGEVVVDGIRVGHYREGAQVRVRPGRHRFELRRQGGEEQTKTVVVTPGRNTEIDLGDTD